MDEGRFVDPLLPLRSTDPTTLDNSVKGVRHFQGPGRIEVGSYLGSLPDSDGELQHGWKVDCC